MKFKILSILVLGSFLAGCQDDAPQTAEVIFKDQGTCNVPGSAADFKSNRGDRVHYRFDRPKAKCKDGDINQDLSSEQTVSCMKEWLCKYGRSGSIVGHCDRRGTSEYNIALGHRRAHHLKKSLIKCGLPESHICGTHSVGKERLLVQGDSEACHAQNRTAVFVLKDGQEVAVPAAVVSQEIDSMPDPKPMEPAPVAAQ